MLNAEASRVTPPEGLVEPNGLNILKIGIPSYRNGASKSP